ncbi:MAG TPA: hypothetical protein VL244_05830, partial [Alphaproteobacteria bacterium]|nr:hypothetical protein [Alphaproteobacteria bacterium]
DAKSTRSKLTQITEAQPQLPEYAMKGPCLQLASRVRDDRLLAAEIEQDMGALAALRFYAYRHTPFAADLHQRADQVASPHYSNIGQICPRVKDTASSGITFRRPGRRPEPARLELL